MNQLISYNRFYSPIIGLIILFLLPSCKNNDEEQFLWDVLPFNVKIHVQDKNGNNLLSPDVTGNIRGKKISAIYDGKEYELNWDSTNNTTNTRYIPAIFYGLKLDQGFTLGDIQYEPDPNKSYLIFGDFDGTQNHNIDLTLHIEGYSQSWNISARHLVKWYGSELSPKNTYTLNGEDVSSNEIIIVL